MNDLTPFIEAYKKKWDEIHLQEAYKWRCVKQFQEVFDLSEPDLKDNFEKATSEEGNLLTSIMYFPKDMFFELAQHRCEETRVLLSFLYDENKPLEERITQYQQKFKKLTLNILDNHEVSNWEKYQEKKNINTYQDLRAISVYLTLKYPNRYYMFKYSVFKKAIELMGYDYDLKKGRVGNIRDFARFCDEVRLSLEADSSLITMYEDNLQMDEYKDESHHLLTQDFIYAVVNHLDEGEQTQKKEIKIVNFKEIESKDIAIKEKSKSSFKAHKGIEYAKEEKAKKELGLSGEKWVIKYEKQRLTDSGKAGLADKIKHVSKEKGDGLGYDILSFNVDGSKRYIEVKTTCGNKQQPFFVSSPELEKSLDESSHYYIYRVYDFDRKANSASLEIIHGSLKYICKIPTEYKVILDSDSL